MAVLESRWAQANFEHPWAVSDISHAGHVYLIGKHLQAMQTTYLVSHQCPPLEMPRLKPISELDHSSRDLPRGIFSNASLVARKKNGVVFVGSLLMVLMVVTCLSVVVDGALAIPWTVCSVQSGSPSPSSSKNWRPVLLTCSSRMLYYRPPACKLRKWLMRNYICGLPGLTKLSTENALPA